MSAPSLPGLLRSFRRQVAAIRVLRIAALVALLPLLVWVSGLQEPAGRRVLFFVVIGGLLLWAWLLTSTVRLTRQVQGAGLLLGVGQTDRAELRLREVLTRFSLSAQGKILACQQLAAVFMRREQFLDVIATCREVLRQPLAGMRSVAVNTRLMLADSLLMLGQVQDAYEAMLPVYSLPLSLADRLKLLPVQLRYELAAGHPETAVRALSEKVRFAELLEPPRAALVHGLLAEACRRQSMTPQSRVLAERARLYHDLEPLAARYKVLAPLLAEPPTS